MLVHVEIPDMSLNLQDPLLRLMGIHPRQTGGPLFCQILTDFARGGRRANSTPGPARGQCGILSMINIPVLFSIYRTTCPHFIPITIFYSIMKDRKDKDYQGSNRQESDH